MPHSHILDDAKLPAANWVLELLDAKDTLEVAPGTTMTTANIGSFQEAMAKPFITKLKNNIKLVCFSRCCLFF